MKKQYSEEQIIGAIKEHESGVKVDDICRTISISVGTFYNWRSKYAANSDNPSIYFLVLSQNQCLIKAFEKISSIPSHTASAEGMNIEGKGLSTQVVC